MPGARTIVLAVLMLTAVLIVLDLVAELIARPALIGLAPKDQLAELTSVRTMLIQALGGVALLGGLTYTARTFRLTEQGQVTDRYTRAIEQMGSSHPTVRAGGVYALERIMKDSDRDHATIVEVLVSFLQEHARPRPDSRKSTTNENEAPSRRLRPPADVAAAIAALRRRPPRHERDPLDLAGLCLIGADLQGANLNNANLRDADLRWALLNGTQLKSAQLHRAKLRRVWLKGARLDGANLYGASLPAAHMANATLQGASLVGIDDFQSAWLDDADLREVELWHSRLQGAFLAGTKLHGAKMHQADLRGVDLRRVGGLTQEQIETACIDTTTELPAGLVRANAEHIEDDPHPPTPDAPPRPVLPQ